MAEPYRPLQGLRVLDLSDVKGAYCTKVIAAQGADVIKVEPLEGESTRSLPPFANDKPNLEGSLWFAHYNTDKKSITLDIEAEAGRALFRELVKVSDLVVESFKPGKMDSLGLGYEALNKLNPRVVLVSITPFGQTGPRRFEESTELTAFATGGIHHMSGLPDYPPCTAPGFMAYDLAGIYASVGLSIALMERLYSGQGQHLDISIQEANAASTNAQVPRYSHEGKFMSRQGYGFQPLGIVKVKDGYVAVIAFREQVLNLGKWMGSELLSNPMWTDTFTLSANADVVRPIIEEWYAQFDMETAYRESQRHHVPSMPAYTLSRFVDDENVKARELFVDFEHPVLGKHKNLREPYSVIGATRSSRQAAPLLGQHNEEVYVGMLGLSKKKLKTLKEAGVI